jgi:hypothetical protein
MNFINNNTEIINAHGVQRSGMWKTIEKNYKKTYPNCACCGLSEPIVPIQVHHIIPVHFAVLLGRPDLELDFRNLISLCESTADLHCENHHNLLGHLHDFGSFNPRVTTDVVTFKNVNQIDFLNSTYFKSAFAQRIKKFCDLSVQEKNELTNYINNLFPKL